MRLVVGIQPVREALRAHGRRVEEVLLQEGPANPALEGLGRFAADQGVAVRRVPRSVLDRRARGARHQGVVAAAPDLVLYELDAIAADPAAAIVALDGVTDPQNFGATIRSAVALGSGAVLYGAHHAAPLTPATFRASAGAIEHARLCQVRSLRSAVAALGEAGLTTVALAASGEHTLREVDLSGPALLVIGAEDKGVSRGVRAACRHVARLDMRGKLDSLNASVAAAVSLYEVARQR